MSDRTPYIRNCYLIPRKVGERMFSMDGKAYLDGYTVLPNEQYSALKDRIAELEDELKKIKGASDYWFDVSDIGEYEARKKHGLD